MKQILKEFYARKEVWFEWSAGAVVALLAVQELLPPWLIIVLILLRNTFAMRGMSNEKKKAE